MYEVAQVILKTFHESGYEAYIVGGYPRDKYMGYESFDIDICTNARPLEIELLFDVVDMKNAHYGCVHISLDSYIFEVTTYRRELEYIDGRHMSSFEYVDTLEEDLTRRDFIMNTLCINNNGEFVDLYGARNDIEHKIIRSVGNCYNKFSEDYLRILRAIRFSTVLDFLLDSEIEKTIYKLKDKVVMLSSFRKKEELDRIFKSKNVLKGIELLKKFSMDSLLKIDLSSVSYCSNYLGIWAQCVALDDYPFTKNEKKIIQNIRSLLMEDPIVEHFDIYGKEICFLVDEIRNDLKYHHLI